MVGIVCIAELVSRKKVGRPRLELPRGRNAPYRASYLLGGD